jgi:transglutaminase-like putative cysteine protease
VLEPFLAVSAVIDWTHPRVLECAERLAKGKRGTIEVAQSCFDWVRSEILHTGDHELEPVTCAASEVLEHGTGFCYAKSHLLAALLRANWIACGFSYQRLNDGDGTPFCLHGLNRVFLPEHGWYRADARGERADLPRAEFDPPREHLPFSPARAGERNFSEILAEPHPGVVAALTRHKTRTALLANLPDAVELGIPDALIAP